VTEAPSQRPSLKDDATSNILKRQDARNTKPDLCEDGPSHPQQRVDQKQEVNRRRMRSKKWRSSR
jgi:hypothetical protein